MTGKKSKVTAYEPEGPSGRRLSPVSVALSDEEYLYSPLDGMLVHRRVTPSITPVPKYTPGMERGTVRVKCLAQEHNAMSPARPRTRTTRSGVERTNHEATAHAQKSGSCEIEMGNTKHCRKQITCSNLSSQRSLWLFAESYIARF